MKLKNDSKNAFIHMQGRTKLLLGVGEVLEVPDSVAKLWLRYDGITEYVETKKEEVKKTTKKSTKVIEEK